MNDLEYKYDPDHIECACCQSEAPVAPISKRSGATELMCEVCASSMVGVIWEYPQMHSGQLTLAQAMAQIANVLLDKLTDRTKDKPEAT